MAQTECSVNPNATGGVDITCHAGEGTTQHITYVHVAGDYHQHKIEIQEPAASWHMGLSIQVVKNPGHCLFDAMAISLGFSSTQVFRAALFLALTKEEYFKTYYALAQKIDPNSRGSSESHFRAYLNSMQYGNEWGDYFDIQLIQQAMRCTIFTIRLDQGLIEKTVMANEKTIAQLEGRTPKKVIVVPGKIVNIVG